MTAMSWTGVLPAITTPFRQDGSVDHPFLREHCRFLLQHGCQGVIALGSLGEGASLDTEEKVAVLRTVVEAAGKAPAVAAIAHASTRGATDLARAAAAAGCSGLMVLPPYVYRGSWPETRAHVGAVIAATGLSCMLYNNPAAYGTDFAPEQVRELAAGFQGLHAVKESSGDARRVTAIKALCGERLQVLVGLDDMVLEGVQAGARGWVAGLCNALPAESVRLFELCSRGDPAALPLYRWFLPLLRLDTGNDFVQCIKLVQQEAARGSERVRPPRLCLQGARREAVLALLAEARAGQR
jgi:1-pyrroline-4-hydroxy-2-carboxylate deaminase